MEADDADHAVGGDQAMTTHVAIGFGWTSRATVADVLSLIRKSVLQIMPGTVLTTLDRRAQVGESIAAALDVPLMTFSAAMLAQITGTTLSSPRSLLAVDTGSVAEASALAALGPAAKLSVSRQTGRLCTCAVAVLP